MKRNIQSVELLDESIWRIIHETPAIDMHTNLYDSRFKDNLLLSGIDELLTDHSLIAELFRYDPRNPENPTKPLSPTDFFKLPKHIQADIVWHRLFLAHSPVSESARGILTSMGLLKQDVGGRDLGAFRDYFASRDLDEHIDDVFKYANLESIVMLTDPFNEDEVEVLDSEAAADERFLAALCIDELLLNWDASYKVLKARGFAVKKTLDKNVYPEIQKFLGEWLDKTNSIYISMSLPAEFDPYEKKSSISKILLKCVLPLCKERNLPLAMMIGLRSNVNPELQKAADSLGYCDVSVIEQLCADNPDNKFMVSLLSRENQHELCVAARKFANLMPFGSWWFMDEPLMVDEITRMRVELLGTSFIPCSSDANVLEQLLYKWAHSRWIIGKALQDKYRDLLRTGWSITEEDLQRDIYNLLAGNFKKFVGLC